MEDVRNRHTLGRLDNSGLYVVLLPKSVVGTVPGQFTMVTKEWSPAMLDHYELSQIGIDHKTVISV
jgi:hypothetical protein